MSQSSPPHHLSSLSALFFNSPYSAVKNNVGQNILSESPEREDGESQVHHNASLAPMVKFPCSCGVFVVFKKRRRGWCCEGKEKILNIGSKLCTLAKRTWKGLFKLERKLLKQLWSYWISCVFFVAWDYNWLRFDRCFVMFCTPLLTMYQVAAGIRNTYRMNPNIVFSPLNSMSIQRLSQDWCDVLLCRFSSFLVAVVDPSHVETVGRVERNESNNDRNVYGPFWELLDTARRHASTENQCHTADEHPVRNIQRSVQTCTSFLKIFLEPFLAFAEAMNALGGLIYQLPPSIPVYSVFVYDF